LIETAIFSSETLCQALSTQPLTTALVREYTNDLQAELHWMFSAGESAERISQYRCEIIDTLLRGIWQQTVHNDKLSLLAVGGYGRGELQPGSDIDLLILAGKDSQLRKSDAELRAFITLLWDMGLEVGQSVRTLAQCVSEARKDITVMTALMETRNLCGKSRVADLERLLSPRRLWSSKQFFNAKLEEQQQRHENFGESSYLLEPNIKESPGGLRDLQTIAWVAKRHYQVGSLEELAKLGFLDDRELETLISSRNLLWWIRTGLHLLSHRKDDQLLFDHQRELATLAGYQDSDHSLAVEAFMKTYYQAVMELRRLNEMFMQRLREEIMMRRGSNRTKRINDRFQVRKKQLEVVDDQVFNRHPEALIEVFLLLARHSETIQGVSAATIRLIRNHCYLIDDQFRHNSAGSQLFLGFLREPHGVSDQLRRMHRYGVLSAFFPEFRRITGQMQHDLFHVYTVDEHSLLCVRNVLRFASAEESANLPGSHDLYLNFDKPELLILAALTHDVGKGLGGNHSELGAKMAAQFCAQLNLSASDNDTVTWLVRSHLDMSSLSQNADISDADVLTRFANHVGNQQNLDYLFLLTIADMQATGPNVWNSWKGSLLKQLYRATLQQLKTGKEQLESSEALSAKKLKTLDLLSAEQISSAQAERLWARLGDSYIRRFSPTEMAWQAKHIIPCLDDPNPLVVATRNFPERGGTGVIVYAADRPNLFATIARQLDQLRLDIVDARILTMADGFALDTFIVLHADGKIINDDLQRSAICDAIQKALGASQLQPKPSARRQDRQTNAFRFPAVIVFKPGRTPATRRLILTTSDQPGLIATVAIILANHYVSILAARINTYGERVQDQFTITLPNLDDAATDELLATLHTELAAALDPGADQPAAPITMDQQF